ncbi:MAG: hypothetical protein JWP44_2332 [Mucilaginibacter sp.]|nr:hypothetical protein [Mucilaginibacter sp.]
MNLADYLSELLRQSDEVSVPGLGYFFRERLNSYYNEREAKFYPPRHQVKFVPELRDDDTFAQYVAAKKNISLASSKYFAEKFVNQLREQAAAGSYLFADIGSFHMDQNQNLVFKPYDQVPNDPDFYGYPPINIYKSVPVDINHHVYHEPVVSPAISAPPVVNTLTEANAAAVADDGEVISTEREVNAPPVLNTPPTVSAQPLQSLQDQNYFEDEPEIKKRTNIWLILLITLTVLALALFGVYKFFPDAADKLDETYHNILGKQDTAVPVYRHEIKADTVKKAVPAKDTTKTAAASVAPLTVPVTDTVKPSHFEIVEFKSRNLGSVKAEIRRLKNKGIEAKLITDDGTGPLLKVSAGTYTTELEANAVRIVLIQARKIKKNSIVEEIKPQQ